MISPANTSPALSPAESRSPRRTRWLLLALLVVAALALGGCGVPLGGVDVQTTEPDGFWQQIVVWPLAKSLIWLDNLLAGWGVPYHWGFAIIVFTILVKVITLPLTISQMRGMQAQRAIQPRVQELQKKYGSDRNKLAEEQMKLYKEAGVNPMGGCLPLLIQMPILFGLYAALVAIGPELANARFFWIPDLGFPTVVAGMGWVMEFFRAGRYGELLAYLILPALLMVTQFIMQKYMSPTPVGDDTQAKTTQQISLVMTFMFGFFTLQVPAGLTLYWVTSNLLQMGQQWWMMSRTTLLAPAPVAATNGATGSASKATVDGAVVGSKGAGSKGASKSSAVATTKATTKPTTVKPTTVKPSTARPSAVKPSGAKRKGSK